MAPCIFCTIWNSRCASSFRPLTANARPSSMCVIGFDGSIASACFRYMRRHHRIVLLQQCLAQQDKRPAGLRLQQHRAVQRLLRAIQLPAAQIARRPSDRRSRHPADSLCISCSSSVRARRHIALRQSDLAQQPMRQRKMRIQSQRSASPPPLPAPSAPGETASAR